MLGYKLVSNFVLGIGRVQRGFWSKVANENLEKKKRRVKTREETRFLGWNESIQSRV